MKSVSIPITQSHSDRFANGRLYGEGPMAIVFSNMDTNDQSEWEPVINALLSDKYMILTYDYPEHIEDQSRTLEDAVSFIIEAGAKRIVLVGASRGGVVSIKVAARNNNNDSIVGVIALSAPIEHEGTVFYNGYELSGIRIPKLLINSEYDDGANDNRKMFDIFEGPKELLFYPGNAHGTELFQKEQAAIIKKLRDFIVSAFTAYDID